MKRKIELLAPAGDVDSLKAAVLAGADAVYCGLDKFNARNRAGNISFDELNGLLHLAHQRQCRIFLTLNVLIVDSELPALINLLNRLVNTGIDGIIVQDFGLFYLLSGYFKSLPIHASTQLTTHNEGQIRFLNCLKAQRVNLSRELNLQEINELSLVAHENSMAIEVFVHGSNCISFSGLCYMSSVLGGNSGNRGRCSQPCRDQYTTTPEGKNFPLNLKDNSAYMDLRALAGAGVDSIKIEGRIKKFHYVFTVVEAWRKQIRNLLERNEQSTDNSALYKAFNRDFTNSYLSGTIHRDMFIDNPRDHSASHLVGLEGGLTDETIEKAKGDIYDERNEIIRSVKTQIDLLSIAKVPVRIRVSGECGSPLKIAVKTPDVSFEVCSETNLADHGKEPVSYEMLMKRLNVINDSEFTLEELDQEHLPAGLYLSFKELTRLKRQLLFVLNGSRAFVDPIGVPLLKKPLSLNSEPALSVIISSVSDVHLCTETAANVYFQLPEGFKRKSADYLTLFQENKGLIPWFPAVLIGEDYRAAVSFLEQLQPVCMVTDNSGIAYEAFRKGLGWIAGPSLNVVNSFSLLCLKENFNCSGAFVSNELSETQIRNMKSPEDFKLYYSIYHPIVLMTSRQCLFHQVGGCGKEEMDAGCIPDCEQSASITNLKKVPFYLEKTKGNYHRVYHALNFLNTAIVKDMSDRFSGFSIDLRDVPTDTKVGMDKSGIIQLFEQLLKGNTEAELELRRVIQPSTHEQYSKGI